MSFQLSVTSELLQLPLTLSLNIPEWIPHHTHTHTQFCPIAHPTTSNTLGHLSMFAIQLRQKRQNFRISKREENLMCFQVQHLHCPQLTAVIGKCIQAKKQFLPLPNRFSLEDFSFIDTTNENKGIHMKCSCFVKLQ